MKLLSYRNGLFTLLAIAAFWVAVPNQAKAIQKKGADTVSTTDVQFTSIPTAADSITIRKKHADSLKKAQAAVKKTDGANKEKPKTLWEIFLLGLVGGFTAVILPCIYPLLPLTVSFFTKKAGNRAKGIAQSLIYGLSIIVIYVTLGMLISIIFGSDALNELASNGIFNLFFFGLLIVFGISFLGAFEITLPSSLANKLDANADKGGLAGIFFMASTLVVVSFSCTGPIIGTLLVDAASKGDRLGPAVGMFGFSLALALPFTIFALFPSALKSLPKSGGWLNFRIGLCLKVFIKCRPGLSLELVRPRNIFIPMDSYWILIGAIPYRKNQIFARQRCALFIYTADHFICRRICLCNLYDTRALGRAAKIDKCIFTANCHTGF
jgi:thiol:disulfide interchange protein